MNYFTALVVRQPDSRPGWAVLDEDGGTAAAAYSSRLLGFNTVAADTRPLQAAVDVTKVVPGDQCTVRGCESRGRIQCL